MNEEELAQSMVDALKESAKAWEELVISVSETLKLTDKYLHCVERLAEASFLTRWYWKWKLKNLTKALERNQRDE